MQVAKVNEYELNLSHSEEKAEPRCIFFKERTCDPNEIKFQICLKCHKCKVVTPENVVPQLFGRIVALAGLLMGLMGMGRGQAAGSGTGGAGGTGGGGGGGGK